MPKKIQCAPSQAKWSVQATQSILLVIGLHELNNQPDFANSEVLQNMLALVHKAQALEIPIIDVYGDDALQGMQWLGEQLATRQQLMIVGKINPFIQQMLPHLSSVTANICLIEDAILLNNQQQHIQWLDSQTAQGIHHMNTYSLKRLWSLSAPPSVILSDQGIVLAIAEQLQLDASHIDLSIPLVQYGLDSIAMVTLVGLWRANGANIRYEDFQTHPNTYQLIEILRTNPKSCPQFESVK